MLDNEFNSKFIGSDKNIEPNCSHKGHPDGFYVVEYLTFRRMGNFVTPNGWKKEILCVECFHDSELTR